MLHKHARAVGSIATNHNLKYLVQDYFDLPRRVALMPALLAKGLGQADLVLCLLRLRDRHTGIRAAAEAAITGLVGHPIATGTPCLLRYRDVAPYARLDASPRVVYVAPHNPRQTGTEAYQRWSEYKIGRTVAQLRARGVKAKDLRVCKQHGWIRLEEEHA